MISENDLKKIDDIEQTINDKYWLAEEVTSHIINFLYKTFPNSIIIREFNKVDITVLDENLPVEIQAVHKNRNNTLQIADFEDSIRRQIEQNIEISGRCWLFIDKKFLLHLNKPTCSKNSINYGLVISFMEI